LVGGAGSDMFAFTASTQSTVKQMDRITDFARGTDTLDLSGMDADSSRGDDQAFRFIGRREFSGAGQLRLSVDQGGVTLLGDTDGNGKADFAIRIASVGQFSVADIIL
jgi:osmotically-inducible protein OsmY